ncbi:MAG: hypothetical protein ABJF10_29510 [Chthoniobacter sp.]
MTVFNSQSRTSMRHDSPAISAICTRSETGSLRKAAESLPDILK